MWRILSADNIEEIGKGVTWTREGFVCRYPTHSSSLLFTTESTIGGFIRSLFDVISYYYIIYYINYETKHMKLDFIPLRRGTVSASSVATDNFCATVQRRFSNCCHDGWNIEKMSFDSRAIEAWPFDDFSGHAVTRISPDCRTTFSRHSLKTISWFFSDLFSKFCM